jgi:hypothetical protein
MSKPHQQKSKSEIATPAAEETLPETEVEIVEEVPASAIVPAATAAIATAPAQASPEERIAAASAKLAELAVSHPDLSGLEEIAMYFGGGVEGAEDLHGTPVPNIRMRQKMTKSESLPGEAKEGELYTQTEVLGPELNVIPLHAAYKRVRFVTGSDRPECSSEDGVTGFKYGPCKTCVHNTMEKGVQPGCSGGWAFGVVTEDFTRIMKVHFTKTSANAGKRLKTLAVRPPAIFQAAFKIHSEKEKNAKGEFYKFAVDPTGRKVTGPKWEAARALSQLFKADYELAVARAATRGASKGAFAGGGGAAAIPANAGEGNPDFGEEGI